MGKAQTLSGIFIALFLLNAGFFVADAKKAQAHAGSVNMDSVLNGRWAALYESFFNKNMMIHEWCVETWGMLNYALFREGSDGVLIGDEGWLFTTEEFDYVPDADENLKRNMDYILSVQRHLEEKNIRLVVALVPAKARVYGAHLGRYDFPGYREDIYADSKTWMENHGIAVADIGAGMRGAVGQPGQPLFLRTDTHWTPAGANLAAKVVGRTVARRWPDLSSDGKKFISAFRGYTTYKGDLLRYIPLAPFIVEEGPQPDRLALYVTEKKADVAIAEDSLFGAQNLPVALVGTSYSANEKFHFAEFLKSALKSDVLNAAEEGMGPLKTMELYLANPAFRDAPPRLVVWEIPERYLPVAYKTDI